MTGVMIQTALLVSAILAIQKVLGDKLHAYVRYGLWLFVAARLLLPVNFIDSSFSMLHIAEAAATKFEQRINNHEDVTDGQPSSDIAQQENAQVHNFGEGLSEKDELWTVNDANALNNHAEEIGNVGFTRAEERITGIAERISPKMIVCVVWIAGSLMVGVFLGVSHIRFRRRLCRTCTAYRGKYVGVIRKKRVPVYLVKNLPSPCLAGIFSPAIYIGKEISTASHMFRYAVAHEEVHYLHRDYIWAFIRAVLVTVYWFHPFVWIAAAASVKDGEIACDYGTIQRIGQKERFAYSEMLLKLSRRSRGKRVYAYGTMLRPGKSELKERVLRLTDGKRSSAWAAALTFVLMAVLVGCAFTDNAQAEGEQKPVQLAENAGGNTHDSSGEKEENQVESKENMEPRQLEPASADITEGTSFGADGPTLDFAGNLGTGKESIVILHDYFGLIVYDLTNQRVVSSLDLAAIGCQLTQGDDACEVAVSADGTTVWLHPRSKQYMYRYEIEEDLLYQEPLVKSFRIDLEGKQLFDRYLVMEEAAQGRSNWQSNYLYEEYKDEQGVHDAYIYLYVPDEETLELGNLQCVWDDMVFILSWDNKDNEASGNQTVPDQTAHDVQTGQELQPEQEPQRDNFPYYYSGAVEDVEIAYDKPCNFSRISDTFGSRIHPVTQEVMVHEGIDFAAEQGTDIVAAADGVVYATGFSTKYGNYVVLLHINGEMTYYCQCAEITVEKDTQVKRGEKIATVGSTGMSTGQHLHFALSRFGEFVNPEEYMQGVIQLD